MKKISVELIKKLREATGAPVIRVKQVLEEVKGEEKKAFVILQKEGFEKAAKREGRETGQGKIFSYVHHNGKIASVVELFSETDFVARNELFETLGKALAMQVAAMGEKNLMEQEFINPPGFQASLLPKAQAVLIKDPSKKIGDLVKEVIAKTGENVRVGRTFRVELGQPAKS